MAMAVGVLAARILATTRSELARRLSDYAARMGPSACLEGARP
jgi:phosphoribosylcarboxyaminoimidazole (NCAIR) mutase